MRERSRSRGFFGRNKARPLSPSKQRLMDEDLPHLNLDVCCPPPDNLSDLFSSSVSSFHLEIGFGSGEHLLASATNNPHIGYFGVEPFIDGIPKLLRGIRESNLSNIRIFDDDAILFLDWLPPACLSRIDLLYPDPWHKRRHSKRRFVNPDNIERFGRVLLLGGELRIVSDIADYINWTLRHLSHNEQFEWTARYPSGWREPWDDWHSTRYEQKAIREGRTPCYLNFILQSSSSQGHESGADK